MINTLLSSVSTEVRATNADDLAPVEAPDLLRVLHVEDNAADALLAQAHLRGVQSTVYFDTAVRLAEITAERAAGADCALLDLSLPDASGLDALIALRAMSEDLPIVVVTGFDDLELALRALRFGADDYLLKNHLDGDVLRRAIRYAIERRHLRMELAQESAATTVASATVFTAEAALAAELTRKNDLTIGRGDTISAGSEPLLGTHEVAVRIDDATGDYALSCHSCEWVAARGSDELHSWAERSLDLVLLYHVDFGGLGRSTSTEQAATAMSEAGQDAAFTERVVTTATEDPRAATAPTISEATPSVIEAACGPELVRRNLAPTHKAVTRRSLLHPARWLGGNDAAGR